MLADFFAFLISLFPSLGGIVPAKKAPVAPRKATPVAVLKQQDFYHTFSYKVFHGRNGMSCQATRINDRWFVTAAHCVKDVCRNSCRIEMDLMDTPVSVKATGWHDSKYTYSVFVHPGYKKTNAAKDDFALIRLDIKNASKIYYQRATRNYPQVKLSRNQFSNWINRFPAAKKQYWDLFSFRAPTIVDFEGGNYEFLRTISVVSILNGKRIVKQNTTPVYYVKNLGYAYTYDFGIRKGMSGSGVLTNKRELVGIIAANVTENYYQNRRRVGGRNWFMFPVFNEEVIAFMQAVMGDEFDTLQIKKAYPGVVKKTNRDFSAIGDLAARAQKR